MSKLAQRLDRLEKAVKKHRVGVCQLCYGHPVASIYEIHESDPNGPGYRKTGEYYLLDRDNDRISDHICCIRCGTPAVRIHLISSTEHAWPRGKRLWVD